ncbi:hypothetical protein CVT24_012158 [Panaeolus cyanescens]|uniref:Uncharacterized protein n=1 Tax=Panaeolus cyanescens TaxID=181874 RepID=A0A409YIY2_9AGAR|nr:hypothetical protein CVT24_012158 [Panaeolus cyanescens]
MASQSNANVEKSHACAKCKTTLAIQGPAAGGKYPGKYYVHCASCHWHHTFFNNPPIVSPPNLESATANLSAPSASTFQPAASNDNRCGATTSRNVACRRPPNRGCVHALCRSCCMAKGGCRIHVHLHQSSTSVASTSTSSAPSLAPAPTLLATYHNAPSNPFTAFTPAQSVPPNTANSIHQSPLVEEDFLQSLIDEDPSIQLQKRVDAAQRAAYEQAMKEKEDEQREDDEFYRTLNALRDFSNVSPWSSSSVRGKPITKVDKGPKPKITSHLSPSWFRSFEDRSSQPPARRNTGQRQTGVSRDEDLEMRSFRLVCWIKEQDTPSVSIVDSCPSWPLWRLVDCEASQSILVGNRIQVYDPSAKIWLDCTPQTYHSVIANGYLLLRRRNLNEESLFQFSTFSDLATEKLVEYAASRTPRAQPSAPATPKVSRNFLAVSRQSFRASGKRKTWDSCEFDSDSEVEASSPVPIPNRYKRSRHNSSHPLSPGNSSVNPISVFDSPGVHSFSVPPLASSSTSALSLSQNLVDLCPPIVHSDGPAFSSPPPPMATSLESGPASSQNSVPFTTTLATTTSGLGDLGNSSQTSQTAQTLLSASWPGNMYAVDMMNAFKLMDELLLSKQGSFSTRFEAVFGQLAPSKSTYHDQYKYWRDGPDDLKAKVVAAGKTVQGSWTLYVKQVRARSKIV